MKKLLLLMLMVSSISFSQNATWDGSVLTLDDVNYTATGTLVASLTADFTVPTSHYNDERNVLNLYYHLHYPNSVAALFPGNTPTITGLNAQYTHHSSSGILLFIGARRSVRNGRFHNETGNIFLYDYNRVETFRGQWNASAGLLPMHYREIIELVTGELEPERLYEFVWEGESVIQVPDSAATLDYTKTHYISGGGGYGILRRSNGEPNRVLRAGRNGFYMQDQDEMVRGRTYYLHQSR